MAEISAKQVKELRDATGAGMMDAKKALAEANGDFEAAAELIKAKGLAKASERSDRETSQGTIAMATNGQAAAMVQLSAETDFSAKSDDFVTICQAMADAVLAGDASATDNFKDELDDLRVSKKENIELSEVIRREAADGNVIDTYLHRQDGRGVIGVIVEASGVAPEALHQVSLHVAFARPVHLSRDEVPAEEVEKERAKALERTKEEGKPEQVWDKIVDGRMTGWFKETVLLEQGLHGDKTTVAQSLGDGQLVSFDLLVIG